MRFASKPKPKRSTYITHSGPVLDWSKPGPKRIRFKPWQDIAALLGASVMFAVFSSLLFWGLSSGAFL